MKKIIIDYDKLYQLYIINGLSKKEVAKQCNCSVDTITSNLRMYNIPSHKGNYKANIRKFVFNNEQKDYLYGALLGDGCLYKGKNSLNAVFSYTSKSFQHVEFATKLFMSYSNEKIKFITVFDKRTNKNYSRYTYRSLSDISFTEEYNHWYSNGVKIIPNDLKLNSTICLLWYLGDGGIIKGKRSNYIKLATHCFSYESINNILIPQLYKFNACIRCVGKSKNGDNQYAIYIPHKNINDFLDYIGNCPFSDYQYKWDVQPYINSIPTNHIMYEKTFCDMYICGVSYYKIAKQFNVEPNVVRYYLIKHKLYKSKKDDICKNAVIQYKNSIPINIFKSALEASKCTKSSYSRICDKTHNNMSNGFHWKKFNDLSDIDKQKIIELFPNFFNNCEV